MHSIRREHSIHSICGHFHRKLLITTGIRERGMCVFSFLAAQGCVLRPSAAGSNDCDLGCSAYFDDFSRSHPLIWTYPRCCFDRAAETLSSVPPAPLPPEPHLHCACRLAVRHPTCSVALLLTSLTPPPPTSRPPLPSSLILSTPPFPPHSVLLSRLPV